MAFGKAEVSSDLAFSIGTQEEEAKRLGRSLRQMLGTKPAPGTNTVLVAHTANLKEAAKLWPKPEGVAFVFKPLGNGNFENIGKLEPQRWPELAKEMGVSNEAPHVDQQVAERHVLCGTKDARVN